MPKTIVIGSDHAGFPLKQDLMKRLEQAGYTVEDKGCYTSESCNTAPIARAVAEEVAGDPQKKEGILICGTGLAMSMMANKVKGIRAALCHDLFSAHATREHNEANILCLGQRVLAANMAWEITRTWLAAKPLGGKYAERLEYIRQYEDAHMI